MQIRIEVAVKHFVALTCSQVCDAIANASHSNHAELCSLQRLLPKKFGIQFVNEALRKNGTTKFQFNGRPGPGHHGKRRWFLFKQEHSARSLFDTAQRIALQNFRRCTRDANAAVIQHEHSFDVAVGELLSRNLPQSSGVLFKVTIEFAGWWHD